jgi:hypothetical protein
MIADRSSSLSIFSPLKITSDAFRHCIIGPSNSWAT